MRAGLRGLAVPILTIGVGGLVYFGQPREASACGCFVPPDPTVPIVQAGERIIFTMQPGFNIPGGGGADPQKARAKEVVKACNKAMQILSKEKYITLPEWKIWWSRRRATFGQADGK